VSDTLSQLAEDLADTVKISASGTYSIGGNLTTNGYSYSNTAITNNGAVSGTLGPYTVTNQTGITSGGYTFTAGASTAPWYSQTPSSKIRLDGADADIEINGISLLTTMQEIQSRLNLLQPNTALEAEWDELFELGRKYRALEQQIKEKQATWDRLKAMPPPVID
jgi:hypothetical protein